MINVAINKLKPPYYDSIEHFYEMNLELPNKERNTLKNLRKNFDIQQVCENGRMFKYTKNIQKSTKEVLYDTPAKFEVK